MSPASLTSCVEFSLFITSLRVLLAATLVLSQVGSKHPTTQVDIRHPSENLSARRIVNITVPFLLSLLDTYMLLRRIPFLRLPQQTTISQKRESWRAAAVLNWYLWQSCSTYRSRIPAPSVTNHHSSFARLYGNQ
jgi:hypothetical protein